MSSTATPNEKGYGDKRAERVARAIEDRIIGLGWPVGRLIGSEQSLMAEYDASRGVLREAVRLLEHHGTARMRRGPGGGLVIQAPTTHAVRRATSLLMQYQQAGSSGLMQARTALELNCLDLIADRIDDPEVAARLAGVLEAEADPANDGDTASFHRVLAELSGSPVLALFVNILLEIHGETCHGEPSDPEPSLLEPSARFTAHRDIYEALLAGDRVLARKMLSSHLDDLADATVARAEHDGEATEEDLPA